MEMVPDKQSYKAKTGFKLSITKSDGNDSEPWWEPTRPGAEFVLAPKAIRDKWLERIGDHLATYYTSLPAYGKWHLEDFPKGYKLYILQKPATDDFVARNDRYLTGFGKHVFRSPDEFFEHAAWLMCGQPRTDTGATACPCKYCTNSKTVVRPKPRRNPAILSAGAAHDPMIRRMHIAKYGFAALTQKRKWRK